MRNINGMSTGEDTTLRKVALKRAVLPGMLLVVAVAAVSYGLSSVWSGLSSLVLALVVGASVATLLKLPSNTYTGIEFAAKPLLKFAVALLGFQISVSAALALGPRVLLVVFITLPLTFVAAVVIGRLIGLPTKLAMLIGAGTSICGASAIAAVNSVVDAEEEDIGFAVATVTLFGTLAIFVIPAIAENLIGLSTEWSAVWAGTSVHEVGQVVAAASPLGAEALQTATLVKLSRVALLVPTVLVIGLLMRDRSGTKAELPIPLFVIGFIGAAILRSTGIIPQDVLSVVQVLDVVLLTIALGALGLKLNVRAMIRLGWRPLILGLLVSLFVAGISLALIVSLGGGG